MPNNENQGSVTDVGNNDLPWLHSLKAAREGLMIAAGGSPLGYENFSSQAVFALRPFMPYCLRQIEPGRIAILNEDFHLIGTCKDPVKTDLAIADENHPCIKALLEIGEGPEVHGMQNGWFLFSDSTAPYRNRDTAWKFLHKLNTVLSS